MTDTQDDLFSWMARGTDPVTSHEAAASVRKRESQQIVLAALREIGPATDEVLVEYLEDKPISPSRARTARCELHRAGAVREAGESKTRSGRRALLWEAA